MSTQLANIGAQIANAASGGALGAIFGEFNDARQVRQQRRLQKLQIEGSKQMTDYQMNKQLEFWRNTSYPEQVRMMEEAGLNPGLMYGMGGGGGVTTGGGAASVSGGQASQNPGEQGMMLQLQAQQAQVEMLKAQADKARAEAEKTRGVDTELGQTQIASLTQGIQNQRAVESLTRIETEFKQLEVAYAGETLQDRIDDVSYTVERGLRTLQILRNEKTISDETVNEKIKIIRQQAIGSVLHNALLRVQTDKTRSDIQVNAAQIRKMANDINVAWSNIDLGWQGVQNTRRQLSQKDIELGIQKFKAEFEANYPGVMDVLGKGLDDGIEELFETLTGQGRRVRRTVQ